MQYAIKNSHVFHIDSAPRDDHYRCPRCGLPVVIGQTTFKHRINNPDCSKSSESEIHLLAKWVIKTQGIVRFPDGVSPVPLKSIEIEKHRSQFIFDVFALQSDDHPVVIEVNHEGPISVKKKDYLQAMDMNGFEICIDENPHEDFLRYIIEEAPRTWVWKATGKKRQLPNESSIERPDPSIHPIYTRELLEDYIHALRSRYSHLENQVFTGRVTQTHNYTGIPSRLRYFLDCSELNTDILKAICVLPGTYPFRKDDVGKPFTFTLNCDPSRMIFNTVTKWSLFLPLALQIEPVISED